MSSLCFYNFYRRVNVWLKGEKSLRGVTKGDLLTQIEEIWRKGKSYHDAQKGDNIQGTLHCEEVETNLSKLIPDDKKDKELKRVDLFVLSAAACLHDIGKNVKISKADEINAAYTLKGTPSK